MTRVADPARPLDTDAAQAQWMHVTFIVVWGVLLLGAIVAFCTGIAADTRTSDAGPMSSDAEAGIAFLASGVLAATGAVVLMVQLGTRIVQLTIRSALASR